MPCAEPGSPDAPVPRPDAEAYPADSAYSADSADTPSRSRLGWLRVRSMRKAPGFVVSSLFDRDYFG